MIERVTLNGIKRRGLAAWKGRERWAHRKVQIWSGEHRAWWRAGGCGYVLTRDRAGVYDFADAWEATKHCGPEKKIAFYPVTP